MKSREDELWDDLAGGAPEPAALPKKRGPKATSPIKRALVQARDLVPAGPLPYEQENPKVVNFLRAYKGSFPFLVSVRDYFETHGRLTEGQTNAVLKSIAYEENKGRAVSAETPSPFVPKPFTIHPGQRIRVGPTQARKFAALAELIRPHFTFEVLFVKVETAHAYLLVLEANAQRSGVCCICGRALTNPESVTHGIGPVCGNGYALNWSSDRAALLQLAEKLKVISKPFETWVPKKAIKEIYESGD